MYKKWEPSASALLVTFILSTRRHEKNVTNVNNKTIAQCMVFSFTDTIETGMIRNDIWILDAGARSERWSEKRGVEKNQLNIIIKVKVHVSFDVIL